MPARRCRPQLISFTRMIVRKRPRIGGDTGQQHPLGMNQLSPRMNQPLSRLRRFTRLIILRISLSRRRSRLRCGRISAVPQPTRAIASPHRLQVTELLAGPPPNPPATRRHGLRMARPAVQETVQERARATAGVPMDPEARMAIQTEAAMAMAGPRIQLRVRQTVITQTVHE